jgi:hypothetical protein
MKASTRLDIRLEKGVKHWRKFPAVTLNHHETEELIKVLPLGPFRENLSETLRDARMKAAYENRMGEKV